MNGRNYCTNRSRRALS